MFPYLLKGKIVLTKVQQTSKRNKKGSILWRFWCHSMYVLPFYLVCVLIILFTTHNSVFFFVLILTISIGDKHIFLGLGKVCCLFIIKIICGVNQYFDIFPGFLCKKQGGKRLTLLMYVLNALVLSLLHVYCISIIYGFGNCMLCNYVSIFTKDQF